MGEWDLFIEGVLSGGFERGIGKSDPETNRAAAVAESAVGRYTLL